MLHEGTWANSLLIVCDCSLAVAGSHFQLQSTRNSQALTIASPMSRCRVPPLSAACSIIESKRWDQSTQNPEDVYRVLAESGLQKLIQEYLHIMVGCRLQQPEVKFTDDIGKVERYDPKVHSELVDGHAVKEWCTVVFPALLVVDGDDGEWNRQRNGVVVGQRFVLAKDEWYRRQEGRRN